MARSEARITVDIWDVNSDFTQLSRPAQGMYFFLLSQPDLAHTGVLGLRTRRWSDAASDLTEDDVIRDLEELECAGKVVIDSGAEELLVRSLIRRDKVFRQPNVLRAAKDTLSTIRSRTIRAALAEELRRVQKMDMPKDSAPIIVEMLEVIDSPLPDPPSNPSDTPSEDPSAGTPGDGGVLRRGSTDSPNPEAPSPDPNTPRSDHAAEVDGFLLDGSGEPLKPPPVGSDDDPNWVEFWSAYPRKDGKVEARRAYVNAVTKRKTDPQTLITGARQYAERMRKQRTEPTKIKMPQGWINGERWNDEGAPRHAQKQGSTAPWDA